MKKSLYPELGEYRRLLKDGWEAVRPVITSSNPCGCSNLDKEDPILYGAEIFAFERISYGLNGTNESGQDITYAPSVCSKILVHPKQFPLEEIEKIGNYEICDGDSIILECVCEGVKREGEGCTKNNNCTYLNCKTYTLKYPIRFHLSPKEELKILDNKPFRKNVYSYLKILKEWDVHYLNAISDIQAVENNGKIEMTVTTHQPGILIGKAGREINALTKYLTKELKKEVKIFITENNLWRNFN